MLPFLQFNVLEKKNLKKSQNWRFQDNKRTFFRIMFFKHTYVSQSVEPS